MFYKRLIVLLILLLIAVFSVNAGEGKVIYSDGSEIVGQLSLTRGRKLKVGITKGMEMLTLEQVIQIRLLPTDRKMEQKWMFPEVGKTRKEKYGEPYPTQNLRAEVLLKDGRKLEGHLYSTVIYVRPPKGKKKKVLIVSKQRGKEGETFTDILFPKQIIISTDPADSKPLLKKVKIADKYMEDGYEYAAVGLPDLMDVKVKKDDENKQLLLYGEFEKGIFLTVKKENKITALWPVENDPELFKLVSESVREMKDFFDHRELKAVYYPGGRELFSLTLMYRAGKTTLNHEKSNPWRLIVQRWKYDKIAKKLLLSSKGWLFRGIIEKNGTLPEISIDTHSIDVD